MSFSSKDFIPNSKYSVSIVEIVDRFWSKVLFNINWVPFFKVVIEKLIRSHTDCKQGISTVLCDLSCYFNYPLFRSPGYFFYCFRAEVFKYVLLYKVKNRAYFHLLPIFY